MKKISSVLVAFLLTFSFIFSSFENVSAEGKVLDLEAKSAVLMDYETGKVLYQKNGNVNIYPASTTKAWTAYLVIKNVPNLDAKITIGDIPNIEPSSMFLKKGETFTVRELLTALLVHSCNDVAYVLAEHVSGSIPKFADLMNREAEKIGCTNTHFNNPHGLPDKNHYTTARDMALIARKCMSDSIFREIVSTKSVKFPSTKQYPQERVYTNSNKFLTSHSKINYKGKNIDIKYDIVDGIKTGFTNDAGKCLLSSAVKDGQRIIAAVFNSTNDGVYLDSRTLIDYGFENYNSFSVMNKEDYISTKRKLFSKQKKLIYQPEESYSVVLPKGQTLTDEFTFETDLDKTSLPIHSGQKVGEFYIYKNGEKFKTINLVAKNTVTSKFAAITQNKFIKVIFAIIKFVLFAFILCLIYLLSRKYYKRYKRKQKKINKVKKKNNSSNDKNDKIVKRDTGKNKKSNTHKRKK